MENTQHKHISPFGPGINILVCFLTHIDYPVSQGPRKVKSIFYIKLKFDLFFRKKKKDKKDEKKILEQINNAIEKKVSEKSEEPKLTKAEMAFLKQQEKLVSIYLLRSI